MFFRKKAVVKTGKKSSNWYFLFALIAAVLAGVLVVGAVSAAVPSERVLVARKNLVPGDVISPATAEERTLPRAALPEDALTVEDLKKGYRLAADLAPGDVLRRAHLAEFKVPGGTVAVRAALLGEGFRAVALPPEATQGLNLVPGDRVDIVGVMDVPALGKGGSETVSRVIVQSAPVVYVPQVDPKDPAAREAQVVVAVRDEAITPLALSMAKGKVIAVTNAEGKASTAKPATLTGVYGLPRGD